MTVNLALENLRSGRPIIVVDDADRENEGDLILAAELATAESVGFTIRHSSGVLCVAMTPSECLRLDLPPMVQRNEDAKGTAYTVSVDARVGTTTGISATERALTIRKLASSESMPADFTRPGHVFPLRAVPGGTAQRRGHTEAGVDLMLLAGLHPAAVIAEIVDDCGEILRGEALAAFAAAHDLQIITMDQVVAAASTLNRDHVPSVAREASTVLPTRHGVFTATSYRSASGAEHVALHMGSVVDHEVLVRLHSECLTGDALGSQRCDCGPQLDAALERIALEGRGAVVYLRGHEGRGIGLNRKLQAYALQDQGVDTVDANLQLGLPVDAREWREAIDILTDLGISQVRLMSNNPHKVDALRRAGISTRREPHQIPVSENAARYLRTKAERMHHHLILGAS